MGYLYIQRSFSAFSQSKYLKVLCILFVYPYTGLPVIFRHIHFVSDAKMQNSQRLGTDFRSDGVSLLICLQGNLDTLQRFRHGVFKTAGDGTCQKECVCLLLALAVAVAEENHAVHASFRGALHASGIHITDKSTDLSICRIKLVQVISLEDL